MGSLDLSIVIPVHNEDENVGRLHPRIESACVGAGLRFEVIYVDDGSTDSTWERLCELPLGQGEIVLVRLSRNYGQTAAIAAGFDRATGRRVVTMDGDLQNDAADIPAIYELGCKGYELVCGWRKNRQDKLWTRKVPSKCANWLIRRVTRVEVHDYGCSLKLFDRELVRQLRLYSDMHRFLPFVAQQAGARVGEMVVDHHPRQFGQTKYGLGRTWKVLLDLVSLNLLVHYCRAPFLLFAKIALPLLVLSAFFAFAWLGAVEEQNIVFLGSFVLLASLGILIVFLGMLGETVLKDAGRDLEVLKIWGATGGSSRS